MTIFQTRSATSTRVLSAVLAALLGLPTSLATQLVAPSRGAAQSFDEFDDEFDDAGRAPPVAAPAPTSDDEFGDADEEAAATSASGTEGASDEEGEASAPARPREGLVTDARGDLLRENGSDAWRARRYVLHNTWGGAVGGLHVVDAGSGPSQSFRVQLLTDFFVQNGFLNSADDNQHVGGVASLSYTPFDFLEVYASLSSRANSNATEDPGLFQVLGDTLLGVRGYYEILPWLVAGGDLSVALLNTVGDIGVVGDSTSVGIRGALSADLRALEGVRFPLIARLNLQYFVDNSATLTNRVEQARYDALPTTGPDARRAYGDEDRHLLTRVERFALGINRTDFFNVALGTEWPIEVAQDFTLSPIVEWTMGVPVNRQGYNCLFVPSAPGSTTPASGSDGCLDVQGAGAFPSTLTLGARVLPPVRGLALTVAVDVGTTGTSSFVRELAGTMPYDVILGASYAVDTVPPYVAPEIREVERTVEVRIPPPVTGHVMGTVVERGTTTPIVGALVAVSGAGAEGLSQLATDASGHFRSYELPPGDYTFTLTHPEYHEGSCAASVPAEGGEVTASCDSEALPRVGSLRGRVDNDAGSAVSGVAVTLSGPVNATLTTDSVGHFARADLPPGSYTVRVDNEAYFLATEHFTVHPREVSEPELTLVTRPARSLVTLRDREISIRRQVNFATDSDQILPDSTALLTEIADVLLRHPELQAVEIQGHTDNRGGREHNLELSQRRADAVMRWLVGAGVEASRLSARGYGDTEPLGQNLTAAGRARNRRVQFVITSRSDGE